MFKKKSYTNKKILGTKAREFDGIQFKSTSEVSCYKKLKAAKLDFSYESEKITIWNGCKLKKIQTYLPSYKTINGKKKMNSNLEFKNKSLLDITYTPDFVINHKNYKIYVDIKGFPNDVYPIKRKMFFRELENRNDNINYVFFEPHNDSQVYQLIEYIKQL